MDEWLPPTSEPATRAETGDSHPLRVLPWVFAWVTFAAPIATGLFIWQVWRAFGMFGTESMVSGVAGSAVARELAAGVVSTGVVVALGLSPGRTATQSKRRSISRWIGCILPAYLWSLCLGFATVVAWNYRTFGVWPRQLRDWVDWMDLVHGTVILAMAFPIAIAIGTFAKRVAAERSLGRLSAAGLGWLIWLVISTFLGVVFGIGRGMVLGILG